MRTILYWLVPLFTLIPGPGAAATSEAGVAVESASSEYMSINMDRVIIDTSGLAQSVEQLAKAVAQLSEEDLNLNEEQQRALLETMQSIDAASDALTALAQLPGSTQGLSEQLPAVVDALRGPLADLADGLQSAHDSIYYITESLPQATEDAQRLVNATLDSAVLRLSIYTLVLVAIVALALIGIFWFIYRQYLGPLARKLDELVGAPEHFDNMSRYMKETSENLLVMQRVGPSASDLRASGVRRYRG